MKKATLLLTVLALLLSVTACNPATPSIASTPSSDTPTSSVEPSAAQAETLTGVAKGFGGELSVTVTLEGDVITAVTVDSHSETAGISDPAFAAIPDAIVAANSTEVENVAGATVTADAIKYAVNNAINPSEYPAPVEKEPEEVVTQSASGLYIGMGTSATMQNLGGLADSEGTLNYYMNKVYVGTIFDEDGKIVDITIDQTEAGTPNIANANMPHFYGWPGQSYNYDEDHDGTIDSVLEVTEELFLESFETMKTKKERGETYMMPAGSWKSQMETFEKFFVGMTIEEIQEWHEKYSDTSGRPLKTENELSDEDQAKLDALTADEQAALVELTAGASMSLNDAHGDILAAIVDSYEKKEPIEVSSIASEGLGVSYIGRIGPGSDSTETSVYSFNETFAYATFDAEGRILTLDVDIYEVMTPNYDGTAPVKFIGWPGTEYNNDADGDGTVDGTIMSEADISQTAVEEFVTKSERGESYMMGAGSWESQMNAFEDFFIGMTTAEIRAWYESSTFDKNGRPLKITDETADEDKAKFDALSEDEQAAMVELVVGATMSVNDPHGDIITAIERAYENRSEVDITVE